MLKNKGNYFILETERTSLLLRAAEDAEVLYYGEKLSDYTGADRLRPSSVFSQWGGGDDREPSLLVRYADGSAESDFRFKSARIAKRVLPETLPFTYGEEKCVRLEYADATAKLKYVLQYTAHPDGDGISVSALLTNVGKKSVVIERMSSLQLELSGGGFTAAVFGGARAAERRTLGAGAFENASFGGASNVRQNPFITLSRKGECYAVQLLYSGGHREYAREDGDKTRLLAGINPFCFSWELKAGETFFAPEAVICFGTDEDEALLRMRRLLYRHVVREKLREKERPVAYFSDAGAASRESVLKNAQRAAEAGAELFVLGADGARGEIAEGDNAGGTESLADEVRALGLAFGLCLEPETVTEENELFCRHPEYCLKIPRRDPKKVDGRRILNLADLQVQGYVFRAVSRAIAQTKAAYVQWHCPRGLSDCYDKSTRGEEFYHRYTLGLYGILAKLVERYPKVQFEMSGERFDAGLLRYLSLGIGDVSAIPSVLALYPLCGVSLLCRFGQPNGFYGAFSGNLTEMAEAEFFRLKHCVGVFKRYRKVLQSGTLYPLASLSGAACGWLAASQNGTLAVAVLFPSDGVRAVGRPFDAKAYYRIGKIEEDGTLCPLSVLSGDLLNKAEIGLTPLGNGVEKSASRLFVFEKIAKKALAAELDVNV